jgi:hypothetical protein
MAEKPARTRRTFTPEERDTALLELALCGGNSGVAADRLREKGFEIGDDVLRHWRLYTYAGRYHELAEGRAREIEDAVVVKQREAAMRAVELQIRATEKTMDALDSGDVKDPSSVVKNAAIAAGVNVDKVLTLTGRPSAIVSHSDPREALERILSRYGAIDSTATEEPTKALSPDKSGSNARED